MKMKLIARRERPGNGDDGSLYDLSARLCRVCCRCGDLALYEKREVQAAADSAAMAGAAEIRYYSIDGTTVAASARAAAAQNGFTDGSNGTTVTVSPATGPTTGPYAGNPAYVEVVIQKAQPTVFMKLFSQTSARSRRGAVAGLGAVNSGCIFILSPNAFSRDGSPREEFNVSCPKLWSYHRFERSECPAIHGETLGP